tara:strand:+ start:1105 stop:1245 length:141 start_codon:yes stop_codon:yes gene_type:complete
LIEAETMIANFFADVAQMVEQLLRKQLVTGSIPVIGSKLLVSTKVM